MFIPACVVALVGSTLADSPALCLLSERPLTSVYDARNINVAQKSAPKPHPEVQKLIDAAMDDKVDWKDMLPLLEKALARARELKDVSGESHALRWLGRIREQLGDRRAALDYYLQAIPLLHSIGDAGAEAATLQNVGKIRFQFGELRLALASFTDAEALSRTAGDVRLEAMITSNIGAIWFSLGESQLAADSYEKALPLIKKVGDRRTEATMLTSFGLVCSSLGNHKKALEQYDQVLVIVRELGDIATEALTLNNIGGVWATLGDFGTASEYLERALPLYRRMGDIRGESLVLNNIGTFWLKRKDGKKSLDYFLPALQGIRKAGDTAIEADTLNNIGFAWECLGKLGVSTAWWKASVNLRQVLREKASGISSRTDRSYFARISSTYNRLTNALTAQGRISEAMQVMAMQEASKIGETTRRDSPILPALALRISLTRLEKKWLSAYEDKAKPLGELGKEREELIKIKERLPEQNKRLQELDKALEAAQKEFQKTLDDMSKAFQNPEPNANDIEDMRRDENLASLAADLSDATGKKTAIIATLVAEDKLFVLLALPSGSPKMVTVPVKRSELSAAATTALKGLTNPQAQPYDGLKKIYDWLIGPLAKDLEGAGIDCLMFNLNGPLRYIPMAALYDGTSYLAEKYQCTNFSLVAKQYLDNEPAKLPWKSAFFGLTQAHEGFSALPGVAEETTDGASDFGTSPRLDEQFSQSALDEILKGRETRLVHFGTHFNLSPGSNEETFMLLGNGQKWRLSELETSDSLGFRGVELLVAAACETGVPTGDDTSIEGFGAYCQIKGAKSVLSSLWKVSDKGTTQWMKTFYKLLSQGGGKGEAFHRAQLAMITGEEAKTLSLPKGGSRAGASIPSQTGEPDKPFIPDPKRLLAHPYYWAPFTLSGNWR